jgi:hypothetical protein
MREVVCKNTKVHFTKRTDRQSLGQESRVPTTQSDVMPLWNRQQQRLPWTCEVVSENIGVRFIRHTI